MDFQFVNLNQQSPSLFQLSKPQHCHLLKIRAQQSTSQRRRFSGNAIRFPISHCSRLAIPIRDYSNTTSLSVEGEDGLFFRFDNVKTLDDSMTLFRQMVTTKPLPPVSCFVRLLNVTLKMKHYSAVVSLFRDMLILGIPINEFVLSIVVNSYCLMHRVDCGFSVLAVYVKSGIPYNDVVTFTIFLKGFFAENRIVKALDLFKKLVRENICEPNEFMYSTIMDGLSKRGFSQKTFDLLREMEQGSTKPNTYIYNIVIDALCKSRMLDAAISLLNEMKQKGNPPDIVTYTSLIDGLCKFGQWGKVTTLFSEMVNLNVYPNVRTFSIVVNGLCKEGKVEDAEQVMRHMIENGVEPNVVIYNMIINGYCLRGQMDRAREFFHSMKDRSIEPDIISYNTLINGYCKKKNLDEAMNLFLENSRNGSKPDIFTYSILLRGLLEVGRIGSAHAIFEKLSLIGLYPNVITYTTMINGFCREGLLDKAKDVLRKMEDNGYTPSNVTYNIILQGFLRCGKISELTTFLKETTGKDFPFDATTLELLIDVIEKDPSLLNLLPQFHSGSKRESQVERLKSQISIRRCTQRRAG